MQRCGRTWLVLAAATEAAAFLLAVYFEPSYCVRGHLHGEAFFDGRPTSYWRGVVEDDLRIDPQVLLGQIPPPPPSFWEQCSQWINPHRKQASSQQLIANPEANEVLWELRQDPNPNIAAFAEAAPAWRLWSSPTKRWMELICEHNINHPPRPDR